MRLCREGYEGYTAQPRDIEYNRRGKLDENPIYVGLLHESSYTLRERYAKMSVFFGSSLRPTNTFISTKPHRKVNGANVLG